MSGELDRASLASLVEDFERHGLQKAVVAARGIRDQSITYAELATLAKRFAAELFKRRIGKGDRVVLWGENGAEWIAAFFGCVLQGVLPVPLDEAGSSEFAQRVAADVAARLMVASADKLVSLSFEGQTLALETLRSAITTSEAREPVSLTPSDPLQIIFTSGTTGEPKGVVHTHQNVLASLLPIERELRKYLKYERIFHPIRFLHTLPLSHVFGQFMGLWIPPLLAAEVHYPDRIVAESLIERIKRKRISVTVATPRVLELMQRSLIQRFPDLPERVAKPSGHTVWRRWWDFRDVHSALGWKFWAFVCGGSTLPEASEHFWKSVGLAVIQGYGMTETTALVSLNHPFHAVQGTIGQVLPGREVRLAQDGEVLVRGETISSATWRNGRVEERKDEWLRTGDLGEFDAQGNLRFRGRKKDVIVTAAGINIHPEDLEAALIRQPEIRAVSIVESETEEGPEPLAVVIPQDTADTQRAIENANKELGSSQQIRRWLIWPEPDFPRTSTGKILRREVARRAAEGVASGSSRAVGDLNLDSLGRVQLQAQLEQKYGLSLDEQAFGRVKTQADVDQLIAKGPGDANQVLEKAAHRYPRWPWNQWQQMIREVFLEAVALPLARFLAKPKVSSEVKTWPSSPMLIVANHVTSYDAPLLFLALPRAVRSKVAIAMSGEMLLDLRRGRNQGSWFLNLVAPAAYFLVTALFNAFPLPQTSGFRESFQHAGAALDRGYSVLVFPEGRRSEDGTPQPFQKGVGLLWKELGVPALPMRLLGLGELKSQKGGWFRSGTIEIAVGEILSLTNDRSPEQLTETLREAVFCKLSR